MSGLNGELARSWKSMEATTRVIASCHRVHDECLNETAGATCIECSKRLSMALPPAAAPSGSEQFSPRQALRSI
jgi:hypothetical protein